MGLRLSNPSPDYRRNVFDLSHRSLHTMSAGMLIPTMVLHLNPSEKAQISLDQLVRTQPLNTAALVRVKTYTHFFFVPYRHLWRGFENFYTGEKYLKSITQNSDRYDSIPTIDVLDILSRIFFSENDPKPPHLGLDYEGSIYAKSADVLGYSLGYGACRLLDMLGYGVNCKVIPYGKTRSEDAVECKSYYELFRKGFFDAVSANQSDSTFTNLQAWLKERVTTEQRFNPFNLLAYQKIYQDFYRRQDYEPQDIGSYNIDDQTTSINVALKRAISMLTLRYRWLSDDYFTGVFPSELGDNTPTTLSSALGLASGKESLSVLSTLQGAKNDAIKIDNNNTNSWDGVSTRSLRAAFALEKMQKRTRRARAYDYASQIEAHFGERLPEFMRHQVEYIGGTSSSVDISEVIATAQGEQTAVGQIFGRGVGTDSGRSIRYEAREHGLVMAVMSIVPETEYNADGVDAFNLKTGRGDYFIPEFQDLGFQPLFALELSNNIGKADFAKYARPLGYVPRYYEYKQSYDRLHGEFRRDGTFSAWTGVQPVQASVSPTKAGVIPSTMLVSPRQLDRIFSVRYDGTETSDQFFVASQFGVSVIRPMSVSSQDI